ncbi:MAG: glycosyltransferase involved in cell wall biosynthesis [Candidatus Azotimanducaceae bacterium]|jgi:glycosyltransferase involved in cell wall biosynthesis
MNSAINSYYQVQLQFKFRREISFVLLIVGVVCLMVTKPLAVKFLMQSHRIFARPLIIAIILKYNLLSEESISGMYTASVNLEGAAGRSIILKFPEVNSEGVVQKGVVVIAFTKTFGFYLKQIDVARLTRYFHIVLEPSWSGYMDADIVGWISKTENTVYVQATELCDRITIESLGSNLKALSFGASDWVDFESFKPENVHKEYDSVYVANTNPIKRIVRYFKAIEKIKLQYPDYKGCLVCAKWGSGSVDDINALAKHFDIESNVEIMFSLRKSRLKTVLSKSKVNILLSFKEGSNRSLFESMFVNIPVICLSENIGSNKSYFNEHTGMLVPDRFLERALVGMIDKWDTYSPCEWAMKNISPRVTTAKLAAVISNNSGGSPIEDIYSKVNNPELSYFDHKAVNYKPINAQLLSLFLSDNTASFSVDALRRLGEDFDRLLNEE